MLHECRTQRTRVEVLAGLYARRPVIETDIRQLEQTLDNFAWAKFRIQESQSSVSPNRRTAHMTRVRRLEEIIDGHPSSSDLDPGHS